ncbi:MAG TPA: hypothetical protein VIT19_10010 [Pyrinomonadaceae bacterium]
MITKKSIATVVSVMIIIVSAVFIFNLKHEVPKPPEWPANVRIYRTSITGETSVFDGNSGRYLFSYDPEYDPNVRPVKIEQLDGKRWQVIFEDPIAK